MELAVDNDMVKSLRIRIKGKANKADITEGVYQRPG